MTFEVRFLPGAEDDLSRIDPEESRRIVWKCRAVLSTNPFPHGKVVRRLTTVKPPLSRLRLGDWRVFFENRGRVVWIEGVARKPQAERTIRRLRPR